jgi:hypothetical protein
LWLRQIWLPLCESYPHQDNMPSSKPWRLPLVPFIQFTCSQLSDPV